MSSLYRNVSLPTRDSHDKTHATGLMAAWSCTEIHQVVLRKIEGLVKEGTTDALTVQRVLKEYVNESMITNLPCETDHSYYSTIADRY